VFLRVGEEGMAIVADELEVGKAVRERGGETG